MSIGWVMFWKAFVVTLWGVFAGWWLTYRKRRSQEGLPTRYSQSKKAYVVFDWTEYAERAAIYGRNIIFGLTFFWWLFIAYHLLTGRRDELTTFVQSWF